MENNQSILEKIEKNTRQQALFMKILVALCGLILLCTLVGTVLIVGAANQLGALAEDMGFLLENLDAISWDLANADIGTMLDNMGTLAADSQAVVAAATEKLEAIDIETLNKAIQDLADIVEPLANISNFFS